MAFSHRVFFLLCGIGGVFGGCPNLWTQFGPNCYIYQNVLKSFEDAETACIALDPAAYLVSISTDDENTEVTNLITSADPWIGLNDIATDGTFVWTDGSTLYPLLPFADTLPQFPNGKKDCVYIAQTDGKWYADDCTKPKPYVCKRPK
nr:lectin BRA-3-like [Nerophis lumbriciformis]XP_061839308.1 lectin BRA-3-like [Nerophis lumbriciformis]XP_061839309.1 lectin BRA-3-like [Nerophis lumbriciformis]XP_061839310.1 lectin BRA-3-like [Nerophis lumbriciformis]XP_061839311.1 lectin BRA-3-like [Nerophis lumbriciformis]